MTILRIPGPPKGKARPRVLRNGHTYTPDPGGWVGEVKRVALEANMEIATGEVVVAVVVHRRIPKSTSNKRRQAIMGQMAGRIPDLVNIEAAIHDALTGIAYDDDRQVAATWAVRVWAEHDATTIAIMPATDLSLTASGMFGKSASLTIPKP